MPQELSAPLRIVDAPLAREVIAGLVDQDGFVTLGLPLAFEEIYGSGGIEGINDLCEERILQSGLVSDLSYKVVGTRGESVLVEVTFLWVDTEGVEE